MAGRSGTVGAKHFVGLDLAWGEKNSTGVARSIPSRAAPGSRRRSRSITPTLPPDLAPAPRRRPARQPGTDELRERVAHVAALLDEAQQGLAAIRRQLDR